MKAAFDIGVPWLLSLLLIVTACGDGTPAGQDAAASDAALDSTEQHDAEQRDGLFDSSSDALLPLDVACTRICGFVQQCGILNAIMPAYSESQCQSWCRTTLKNQTTTCASCFPSTADLSTCGSVFRSPQDPYNVASRNPGSCIIECGLGACEGDGDCTAASDSCQYLGDAWGALLRSIRHWRSYRSPNVSAPARRGAVRLSYGPRSPAASTAITKGRTTG